MTSLALVNIVSWLTEADSYQDTIADVVIHGKSLGDDFLMAGSDKWLAKMKKIISEKFLVGTVEEKDYL